MPLSHVSRGSSRQMVRGPGARRGGKSGPVMEMWDLWCVAAKGDSAAWEECLVNTLQVGKATEF